jgi:hypothetical protein
MRAFLKLSASTFRSIFDGLSGSLAQALSEVIFTRREEMTLCA